MSRKYCKNIFSRYMSPPLFNNYIIGLPFVTYEKTSSPIRTSRGRPSEPAAVIAAGHNV